MKNRTVSSIKNTIGAVTSNLLTIVINFVAQALFIRLLGIKYSGINGLFTNILVMLGIVEMGIGNSIIFHLYKPIAEGDNEKIKSLMKFYKKSYNIIAIVVLFLGITIIPFLKYIVGTVDLNINLTFVYLLFLCETVFGYLLSYKRSILYADQKNYIINIIHIFYLFILNILQLFVLFLTKNYYLYLIIKIIMKILENLFITLVANKKYPFLKDKNVKKLDKDIEKDIFKKIKAIFFHKLGGFVVNGSDNIIISMFLGIETVGLYSNYYLIINAVQILFTQVIVSTTASIGNLLSTNVNNAFKVFKRIRFLNFWIICFSATSLLVVMNPFIKLWIGEKYLLSLGVLIVLVFNYYQKTMRNCFSVFKDAAGIYYEDRFVPIIESLINISFSVILLKLFGLIGVFLGTVISGLILWCYSYPKFVYKKLFNRNYFNYSIETFGYMLLFIIISSVTYLLSNMFIINNIYIKVVINLIICIIVPNASIILIFHKTDNFKYFMNLISNILKKLFKRKTKKDKLDNKYPMFNQNLDLEYINLYGYSNSDQDNINNYLDDLDRVKMKIRFNNSVIGLIDFNKCSDEISDVILSETKVYNFEFDNKLFLRKGKYPKQIANNYELMKYIIDQDYNNLAYVDVNNIGNDNLIDIINYAFTKVYYMKIKNSEIDFDIDNIFKNSSVIKHDYFKECYSYIKKMKGRKEK